jgi:hypothetical protein
LKRFCNAIIFFIFQNISPNSKQGRNWKDPWSFWRTRLSRDDGFPWLYALDLEELF